MKSVDNFFIESDKSTFYKEVNAWVENNLDNTFYILPLQQSKNLFYDFCSAVLEYNKIPVLITNVSGWDSKYPSNLQRALNLSSDIRIYEAAKMGMSVVLLNKAKQFVKVNGGLIWTQ